MTMSEQDKAVRDGFAAGLHLAAYVVAKAVLTDEDEVNLSFDIPEVVDEEFAQIYSEALMMMANENLSVSQRSQLAEGILAQLEKK